MPTDLIIDRLNKYGEAINKLHIDNEILMQKATRQYTKIRSDVNEQKRRLKRKEHKKAMASAQVVPEPAVDSYKEIENKVMDLYCSLVNVHTSLEILLVETKALNRQVKQLNRTGELIERFENNS
jgi:hypothetical protein